MNIARKLSAVVGLFGMLLFVVPALWTQEVPQAMPAGEVEASEPEGVQVLARGPVHEAYAEPSSGKLKPMPVIGKQPPDPIEELPPDQKPDGDNVQWLPGYWAWDEEKSDFLWVSGFWRSPPPGRQWVPGRWDRVEAGWQWVAGFWAMQQQDNITYLPPPPEPVDLGPSVPAPSAQHVYVQGCWVYRDGRYVWRPGFWHLTRREWVWVPAHYVWTPSGYVFVDGYWDYPLRERGLLFAPVHVDVVVRTRPGWCYTPCYVIDDDCLVSALFVRPGHCHYYFGDYFEPCHRQAGYVAFYEVRVGRHCSDPLFTYYSYHHRERADWEVSLRFTYGARYRGEIPRPPRTLVQQNTVVKNITVNNIQNNTVNNVTINKNVNVQNSNVQVIKSLKQVEKKGVALKPVTVEDRKAERASADELRKVAETRNKVETQLRAQGAAPGRPSDAPRVAKVELPKPKAQPAAITAPMNAKTLMPRPAENRPAAKGDGKPPVIGAKQPPTPSIQKMETKGPVVPARAMTPPPVKQAAPPQPAAKTAPKAAPPRPAPTPAKESRKGDDKKDKEKKGK